MFRQLLYMAPIVLLLGASGYAAEQEPETKQVPPEQTPKNDDEAKKVFDRMVAKVTNCKALELEMNVHLRDLGQQPRPGAPAAGLGWFRSVFSVDGNKLGLIENGNMGPKDFRRTAQCNGDRLAFRGFGPAKAEHVDAPKDLAKNALAFVVNVGSWPGKFGSKQWLLWDLPEYSLSEFALGDKVTFSDWDAKEKPARIVKYKGTLKKTATSPEETVQLQVWINLQTDMPLKRTIEFGPNAIIITASYRFDLSPRFAPNTFGLSKGKRDKKPNE